MTTNAEPLIIRRVKNTDVPRILKLVTDILETEFGKEASVYPQIDLYDLEISYGGTRDCFWVAEKNAEIIGTIAIKEEDRNTALLRRIFVDARYRGRGYGLQLVEKAIEFCRQKNYRKINFRGTSRMTTALNLCRKKGFQEVDRIPMEDFHIIRCSFRLPHESNSHHPHHARH